MKKSCKNGSYGSFQHVLILFSGGRGMMLLMLLVIYMRTCFGGYTSMYVCSFHFTFTFPMNLLTTRSQ